MENSVNAHMPKHRLFLNASSEQIKSRCWLILTFLDHLLGYLLEKYQKHYMCLVEEVCFIVYVKVQAVFLFWIAGVSGDF